jgi:hypothetical protein
MLASVLTWPQVGRTAVTVLAVVCALLGCSVFAQTEAIRGFRLVDQQTIIVLARTASGWETWVSSVQESPTRVVVEVRTKPPLGVSGLPGQDLWLTVDLKAPLGDRDVFDAAGSAAVSLVP